MVTQKCMKYRNFCTALFSLSFLLATADKKVNTQLSPNNEHALSQLSPAQIIEEMHYLYLSQDIQKMVHFIKGLPSETTNAVANILVKKPDTSLSRDQKLQFLYGLVTSYSHNKKAQNALLDLIITTPLLLEGQPLLLTAARFVPKVIPALIEWAKNSKVKKGEAQLAREIVRLIPEAVEQAILQNDVAALTTMFDNGVSLKSGPVSHMAWVAVKHNKDSNFIPLLVSKGADINYQHNGYSLLMKAVDNNNLELVKMIVQTKPKELTINKQHDPKIGTALTRAIEKGHADIDEYLRSQGAKENITSF